MTVHSLLRLPVGSQRRGNLKAQNLCRLQENLRGIDCIIIDEYSMLGQVALGVGNKQLDFMKKFLWKIYDPVW